MTAAAARGALARALRVPDAEQLEAMRYLEALDKARARMKDCQQCGGLGEVIDFAGVRAKLCECLAGESPSVLRDLGVTPGGRPPKND